MNALKEKTVLFTRRQLLYLYVPLLVEQLFMLLFGFVDSAMVSWIGEAAVSGVSLVNAAMTLFGGIFAALAAGGAVVIGQYIGRKEAESASEAAGQLIWLAGLASVLLMGAAYLLKPLVWEVFFGQAEAAVRAYADAYFQIVAASIPFLALYNAGAVIFRANGNSSISLLIMLATNILNVVGNAVLAFEMQLGVQGIAIATLTSRLLAAAAILVLTLRQSQTFHLRRSLVKRPERRMAWRILAIGAPGSVENGIFYLGRIMVMSLVSTLGTSAIAAGSIAGTIATFTTLPGVAVNLAMTAVMSRCIGTGDYEQARYYHKKMIAFVFIAHLIVNSVLIALLPEILDIYGLTGSVAGLTEEIVWWHSLMAVAIWPLAYTQPVTFRSAGDARYPMAVGMATMFLCRIVMAYILSGYCNMGVLGVFAAIFMDWFVKAVIFTYRYVRGDWQRVNIAAL